MADKYLTIKEVEDLFASLTDTLIAGGPVAEVRIDWPTAGAPAWGIGQNVIFIQAIEQEGAYNKQRERLYEIADAETFTQSTAYTRILDLKWIIYGPDSYDLSQMIKDNLFEQVNHDKLVQLGIYIIPDIAAAKRVPELFVDQWWERVDLNINFYELIVKEKPVYRIKIVEDSGIYTDNGIFRPIYVT